MKKCHVMMLSVLIFASGASGQLKVKNSTNQDLIYCRQDGRVGIGTVNPSFNTRLSIASGHSNAALDVSNELLLSDPDNTSWLSWVAFDIYRFDASDFNSGYIALFTDIPRDANFLVANMGLDGTVEKSMNLIVDGHAAIGLNYPGSWVNPSTGFETHLIVNGNAAKTLGGASWHTWSDARLKDIEGQYQHGLAEILKINPIKFHYKTDNVLQCKSDVSQIGLIAQELQNVIPEAVAETQSGYLTVNADPVLWAMLNAIKELNAKNQELQAQIDALKAR